MIIFYGRLALVYCEERQSAEEPLPAFSMLAFSRWDYSLKSTAATDSMNSAIQTSISVSYHGYDLTSAIQTSIRLSNHGHDMASALQTSIRVSYHGYDLASAIHTSNGEVTMVAT